MPSSRLLAVVTAVALAIVVPSAHAGTLIERILAVVNGRPVTLSDVRAAQEEDGSTLQEALERVIDESLLFEEAFRLPQLPDPGAPPSAAGKPPGRRRLRERRAVIERYIALRFRPQIRAEGAEAREAETKARVADWVRDLRAGARIRYNAFGSPVDERGPES